MRHLLMQPQPGFLPIYLDLEDIDSPEEFAWRITRELLANDRWRAFLNSTKGLPKKLQNWVKDTFDEIGFSEGKVAFKDSVAENWEEVTRRLLATLENAPERALILLDELPSILEKMHEAQGEAVAYKFLSWFRTVRQQQKDTLRRHRFVVAGSIGIDVILRSLNATDKLNDFHRIPVEPISHDDALRLIQGLARSIDANVSGSLQNHILELIGAPVPYFIHLFFSQLGQRTSEERKNLDRTILESVYNTRVQGPACKRYFDHYRDRLKRFGKAGEKAAMAILSSIVAAPTGRIAESSLFAIYKKNRGKGWSDNEFTELMNDLECDWYLTRDPRTNEYFFMVKVIADWWRRWFGRITQK